MNEFISQIEKLKYDLCLELHWNDGRFGEEDSSFYFHKPEWNFGIGFGFDNSWMNNFYYGICNKEGEKMSMELRYEIETRLGKFEETKIETPTENWPFWQWSNDRNWNVQTFEKISNGEMSKWILNEVKEIEKHLEDLIS
jgi:hypothetical protein